MIQVKKILDTDTLVIRKKELRKNIDLPPRFTGDQDEDTHHFGLFAGQVLVSVVSFMKVNFQDFQGNQYQLRGMATLEEFQKKGYGEILVAESEKFLKNQNVDLIWCNARVRALNFYFKQGYKKYGDEFNIPKIGGHYVLFKLL